MKPTQISRHNAINPIKNQSHRRRRCGGGPRLDILHSSSTDGPSATGRKSTGGGMTPLDWDLASCPELRLSLFHAGASGGTGASEPTGGVAGVLVTPGSFAPQLEQYLSSAPFSWPHWVQVCTGAPRCQDKRTRSGVHRLGIEPRIERIPKANPKQVECEG